jgi:hypothetical protein
VGCGKQHRKRSALRHAHYGGPFDPSVRWSRVGNWPRRSERPVPRLSNMVTIKARTAARMLSSQFEYGRAGCLGDWKPVTSISRQKRVPPKQGQVIMKCRFRGQRSEGASLRRLRGDAILRDVRDQTDSARCGVLFRSPIRMAASSSRQSGRSGSPHVKGRQGNNADPECQRAAAGYVASEADRYG